MTNKQFKRVKVGDIVRLCNEFPDNLKGKEVKVLSITGTTCIVDRADYRANISAALIVETKPLNPFEQWMVKSNLERLKIEGLETIVDRLRATGYYRVADAVEKEGSAQ